MASKDGRARMGALSVISVAFGGMGLAMRGIAIDQYMRRR
jgi:hypothetical protein